MATVRKPITLTNQQDDWIKSQVEGGDYTNDREYIRDLIRREQERGRRDRGGSCRIDRG
jgi:antitoxin ParD1/3/4